MLAVDHETYEAYCAYNAKLGYQVIGHNLWNALKAERN